jgi:hypothetical protein
VGAARGVGINSNHPSENVTISATCDTGKLTLSFFACRDDDLMFTFGLIPQLLLVVIEATRCLSGHGNTLLVASHML